jgi:hypothetical protein
LKIVCSSIVTPSHHGRLAHRGDAQDLFLANDRHPDALQAERTETAHFEISDGPFAKLADVAIHQSEIRWRVGPEILRFRDFSRRRSFPAPDFAEQPGARIHPEALCGSGRDFQCDGSFGHRQSGKIAAVSRALPPPLSQATKAPPKMQSRSQARIVLFERTRLECFATGFLKIPMMEGQGMKDACRDSGGRSQFVGRTRRLYTDAVTQVQVTLSVDLLNHLRTESQSKHVPLRWLVAGLVCDTMNTDSDRSLIANRAIRN